MPKPRTPNQRNRYAALNKRLAKYVSFVQTIYDQLGIEAADIIAVATDYSGEQPFRFKNYPQTNSRVNGLMALFSHNLQALIHAGTAEEWKQSNLAQDTLASSVLKTYRIRNAKAEYVQYFQPNESALKAFQARKDKGLTVSQKIWRQSYNFKRELEYAISSAIVQGQSAMELSSRICKYLHDFSSLQDDYKRQFGEVMQCNNCEYRSIRLARSEINMAYREAEQTRWRQMDFIKGYEIKLSHSHPKKDICDDLAGVYPKWFKWTGWHPNDLCYAIPIVMTDDEWYSGSAHMIDDVPDNIKAWLQDNGERVIKAEQHDALPYWIADNQIMLSQPLSVAKQSARGIQMGRNARNSIFKEFGKEDIPKFREEQTENNSAIEKILGIKKRPFMGFEDADSGNGNFDYDGSDLYIKNCQCCVYAHELRRRGFDVTARGNTERGFYAQLEDDTALGWLTRGGKEIKVSYVRSPKNDAEELYNKVYKQLSSGGRYTVEWNYKRADLEGHIVCSEVINGKLVIYDPQRNNFLNLREIIELANIDEGIGLLRVDGLIMNLSYVDKIVRPLR